jgi:hypothetical protein
MSPTLAKLSPLVASPRPSGQGLLKTTPKLPFDRFEPGPPEPASHSDWKKVLLGSVSGLAVLSGMGLYTHAGQALVQQIEHPHSPAQDLVDQLHGYAGDKATDRKAVIGTLRDNFSQVARDGSISVADLNRVAADPSVSEDLRESARALLADPVLLRSVDVAASPRVEYKISLEDLNQAWRNEQGGNFGSFSDMCWRLQTPSENGKSAFDQFASLGQTDKKINFDELRESLVRPDTTATTRLLAHDLLANPNYMNAFDVAGASNSPGILQFLNPSNQKDGVVTAADLDLIALSPLPETGRQFTASDQAALDRVLTGQATLDKDLFQSFYQTDRGNCASTATIKAAFKEFGPQLFRQVEKQPDGSYTVTMRDGFRLQLSPSELEAAATATHFYGNHDETKALANFSYAAMAKRAWAMGNEKAQTYGQALLSLNNGEVTWGVPAYLGLEDYVKSIPVAEAASHPAAVVFGNGHAYYVENVNGHLQGDKWGTATKFEGKASVDEGALDKEAFILGH